MKKFETTREVDIPLDPFSRIIGQPEAVEIARIAASQRRHLLLVGPPGTGKSLIAKAIASILPKPKFEVSVMENKDNLERPILQIRPREDVEKDADRKKERVGKEISIGEVPSFVAERLGFRCKRCGAISPVQEIFCPHCGADKSVFSGQSSVNSRNTRLNVYDTGMQKIDNLRVYTTRRSQDGKEEMIVYERTPDNRILMLNRDDLVKLKGKTAFPERKIIIPLDRSMFVQASGASEVELLGDVKHDPYGGHQQIGTPAFLRVVPGAIHEAHEGVLYIDELSTLGELQRNILTAMQDKVFAITGKSPTSTGAAIKVPSVPCDFILVGAVNISDLPTLLPAIRSRIRGDGYEVLLKTVMEDNPKNVESLIQFIDQEISKDGKIPHASKATVDDIIIEARKLAKKVDNENGLTLRLRALSGIVKLSGDYAVMQKSKLIEPEHVKFAIEHSKSVEEQLHEKYGNWYTVAGLDSKTNANKGGAESI
ncbi:MAG: ATP-binding protein [Candidatus Bilamarchaeaceae archaeon]